MGGYMLAEMREIRRGMESNNDVIRREITNIRKDIGDLSTKVVASQNEVARVDKRVEEEVARIEGQIVGIHEDVTVLKTQGLRQDSAWDGPRRFLAWVGAIGGLFGATLIALKLSQSVTFLPS